MGQPPAPQTRHRQYQSQPPPGLALPITAARHGSDKSANPIRDDCASILDSCHRHLLMINRWREVRSSEKSLEQSPGPFWFRQVDVHKHHASDIEHQATVGISCDHNGGFTCIILNFLYYLLTKRTIWIVPPPVFRWIVTSSKTIRQLLRGLVGKGLCLGNVLGRPTPAKKISTLTSGPELREVHTAKMGRPPNRGKNIFTKNKHLNTRGCVRENAAD